MGDTLAHTISAKKRIRQSIKRNQANKQVKSAIRTQEKKIRKLVESSKIEEAATELRSYYSAMDKAGRKYIIHPNTVARKKSRLCMLIKKAENGGTPKTEPATTTETQGTQETQTTQEIDENTSNKETNTEQD